MLRQTLKAARNICNRFVDFIGTAAMFSHVSSIGASYDRSLKRNDTSLAECAGDGITTTRVKRATEGTMNDYITTTTTRAQNNGRNVHQRLLTVRHTNQKMATMTTETGHQ